VLPTLWHQPQVLFAGTTPLYVLFSPRKNLEAITNAA